MNDAGCLNRGLKGLVAHPGIKLELHNWEKLHHPEDIQNLESQQRKGGPPSCVLLNAGLWEHRHLALAAQAVSQTASRRPKWGFAPWGTVCDLSRHVP